MQQIKQLSLWIFLVFVSFTYAQTSAPDTTRILFIGNSYTYYNSSPELLRSMVRQKHPDQEIEVQLVSQGGMTLERHWQQDRTHEAINSKDWDYVILQEQSKLGMPVIIDQEIYFGQTDLFFNYARKFDTEIKKAGAKTVFFMTWSVKSRPEEQEILTYAYASIAQELNATVAPVGLVWDVLRETDQFDLYDVDGSHPSAHGSYLVAATMYATMFKEDPAGLSGVIAGKRLTSSGASTLARQELVNISDADARMIQKASWNVTEDLQKTKGLQNLKQPALTYRVPVLTEGKSINQEIIKGRWYGNSTYGSNYLGLIMDIKEKDEKPEIQLSFYTPENKDKMTVKDVKIFDKILEFTITDSLRNMDSKLEFSLSEGQLSGISTSIGSRFKQYKHWYLSKEAKQGKTDLEAMDQLIQIFQKDKTQGNYSDAAIAHYKRYSELIGNEYLPEEEYLNGTGYNLLSDQKTDEALDVFELANTLYPESVNTYDSYGEALVIDGQKEKAIAVFTEGYELAKKTGDPALGYIEANLKKLKDGALRNSPANIPAPPPPPQ